MLDLSSVCPKPAPACCSLRSTCRSMNLPLQTFVETVCMPFAPSLQRGGLQSATEEQARHRRDGPVPSPLLAFDFAPRPGQQTPLRRPKLSLCSLTRSLSPLPLSHFSNPPCPLSTLVAMPAWSRLVTVRLYPNPVHASVGEANGPCAWMCREQLQYFDKFTSVSASTLQQHALTLLTMYPATPRPGHSSECGYDGD